MSELTDALFSAMQTISEATARKQKITSVIEAEIVDLVDAGLGTYEVSYLGNRFEATTSQTNNTYEIGDIVYVLVPEGNFDKNKIILSLVTPSVSEHIDINSQSEYIPLGNNLFKSVADVSLCTYKTREPASISGVDTTGFSALFKAALTDSRIFNFTCKIQTNIEKDRRSNGNYGLILDIPVIQEINGVPVSRYYSITLDTSNMIGDPYNFAVPALQNLYFELPEDMEYDNSSIPRIRSFVLNFIGQDPTAEDDIFIKDIQLLSVYALSNENKTGYYSIITASEGNSFLATRTNSFKVLSVQPYLNGKPLSADNFECYWFKENVSIISTSEKYQKYGGVGWEILNKVSKKNVNDDGRISYQYVTDSYTQKINQTDIHCDTRFKCVLVSKDQTISSIVVIKNLASTAILELKTSTSSTIYPVGVGNVELQLKYQEDGITDVVAPNFVIGYDWQRFDKNNNYIDNDFYITKDFNKKENNAYITSISFPVEKIDELNTVACTVYLDNPSTTDDSIKRQTIGTARILISTEAESTGRIVLTNDDKVYKYDADGDSPMVADYDGPVSSVIKKIDPIKVNLYKENGLEFSLDEYRVTTITWLVPIDSMYSLTSSQKSDTTSNPGYYTISGKYSDGYDSLSYNIANIYNKNKTNNTIIIKASAPSAVLSTTLSTVANIKFLKDGEAGTNGSKYTAIITYNGYGYGEKYTNGLDYKLQLVYAANNDTWYLYNPAIPGNFSRFNSAQLRVALYADGALVNAASTADWEIFDDDYFDIEDIVFSPVEVSSNGTLSLNGEEWDETEYNFCTTIRARVAASRNSTVSSQTNSEEYVYAYYPIECTRITNSNYLSSGMPTMIGGFSKVTYASDGTNPQYDNSELFSIADTQYGQSVDNLYNFNWSTSSNMSAVNSNNSSCKVIPSSKYDNGVAKNFVRVALSRSSSQVAEITRQKNECQAQLDTANRRLNYYTILQNNLDIFENFDYNNYVTRLTNFTTFYNAKTKFVGCVQNLLTLINNVDNLCRDYLYNDGVIDQDIQRVLFETEELLLTLNNLANLSLKLGTENGIIENIRTVVPSSLSIENKIDYPHGIPGRNCYFSINDSIDSYNSIVTNAYSIYYNELCSGEVPAQENNVIAVIDDLSTFVNDNRFNNLANTYDGVNEEAYRYVALNSVLKNRAEDAAELMADSYTLLIENVLKPINSNLSWYIDFNAEGGYTSKINEITEERNTLQNRISILNNMLLPGSSVEVIHVRPVIMIFNRYELSNINGWDGNKLDLNEEEGYILAPQMGAGKKDNENKFTGVVMGVKQIQERSTIGQKIGLFGFSQGMQSFFLNAEDGSATFGKENGGQIIIEPGSNTAIIKSGDYNEDLGTGMMIDLKEPCIKFGSGNFKVDADGTVTALKGHLGSFELDKYQIKTSRELVDQGYGICLQLPRPELHTKYSFAIGYSDYLSYENAPFKVMHNGTLICTKGQIGGWYIGEYEINEQGDKVDAIYSGHEDPEDPSTIIPDIIMRSDGSIEANYKEENGGQEIKGWKLDKDGTIKAYEGNIGGWDLVHEDPDVQPAIFDKVKGFVGKSIWMDRVTPRIIEGITKIIAGVYLEGKFRVYGSERDFETGYCITQDGTANFATSVTTAKLQTGKLQTTSIYDSFDDSYVMYFDQDLKRISFNKYKQLGCSYMGEGPWLYTGIINFNKTLEQDIIVNRSDGQELIVASHPIMEISFRNHGDNPEFIYLGDADHVMVQYNNNYY